MHTIRLRDPWDSELTPQGWQFSRRFQKPTGLNPGDHVFLEIEQIAHGGIVRLNGSELGPLVPGAINRWEITAQIHARNLIMLELAYAEELLPEARKVPGDAVGEVRLEIEESVKCEV